MPPFNPNYVAKSNILNKLEQSVTKLPTALTKVLGEFTNPLKQTEGFSSGQEPSKQKFNDVFHDIELYLDNSGDFTTYNFKNRYFINPAAVIALNITDTLYDWVVNGSITIMYLPEDAPIGETGQSRDSATKGAVDNGNTLKSYQFRNDGYDLLRIMIVPNLEEPSGENLGIKIDKNDPKWILSYLFSIYEIEDLNEMPKMDGPLSTYMKCIKLHFRDIRYHILENTNLEWSTANSPEMKENPDFANKPVIKTGQAIKEILEEALTKPEKGGSPKLFEFPAALEDWNYGSSELFYTSPAGYSALDDINYLFAHHVSDKPVDDGGHSGLDLKDLCLLHTKRPTDRSKLEQLCITPISNFFEKAGKEKDTPGELQLEHFFVTSHTSEAKTSALFRAPLATNGESGTDLKTTKYGQIVSYCFVDMNASMNCSAFATHPVCSVDIGKRSFFVEFKGNDTITARKVLAKSYISHLYHQGGDTEKLFLPSIHETKKDINIFPTFSVNGDNLIVRQRNGLHSLLFTGLFQNACICFRSLGLTLRETGSFIGIDKVEGCADNDFNNKLYGQWFVIKVDHVFEAGAYMNHIYAIKMHRFADPELKFEHTL